MNPPNDFDDDFGVGELWNSIYTGQIPPMPGANQIPPQIPNMFPQMPVGQPQLLPQGGMRLTLNDLLKTTPAYNHETLAFRHSQLMNGQITEQVFYQQARLLMMGNNRKREDDSLVIFNSRDDHANKRQRTIGDQGPQDGTDGSKIETENLMDSMAYTGFKLKDEEDQLQRSFAESTQFVPNGYVAGVDRICKSNFLNQLKLKSIVKQIGMINFTHSQRK